MNLWTPLSKFCRKTSAYNCATDACTSDVLLLFSPKFVHKCVTMKLGHTAIESRPFEAKPVRWMVIGHKLSLPCGVTWAHEINCSRVSSTNMSNVRSLCRLCSPQNFAAYKLVALLLHDSTVEIPAQHADGTLQSPQPVAATWEQHQTTPRYHNARFGCCCCWRCYGCGWRNWSRQSSTLNTVTEVNMYEMLAFTVSLAKDISDVRA
jgi:hypothetical protein